MNASISSRPRAVGGVERALDIGRRSARAASRRARACRPRAHESTTRRAARSAARCRPPRPRDPRAAPRTSRRRAGSPTAARRRRRDPACGSRPRRARTAGDSCSGGITRALIRAVERMPQRTGSTGAQHRLPRDETSSSWRTAARSRCAIFRACRARRNRDRRGRRARRPRLAARALAPTRRSRSRRTSTRPSTCAPRARAAPTRCIPATASSPRAPSFAEAVARRRAHLDRAAAGGAARRRRQARGEGDRARRRRARAADGTPRRDRLPAAREGGRGRRRPRHARRPHRRTSSTTPSRPRGARPRRRSATTPSSSSATSSGRATSRSSSSPTRTARSSRSASATARCSAATRRCSRSRPRRARPGAARARMSDAAVAFARAIGYESAGTAEFVLDGRDFFFLELNARIQVEHPVTELVTGVDLVREQLRIAGGEPSSSTTRTCRARGRGAPLRRGSAHVPAAGRDGSSGCGCRDGIRVDAGVEEGDEIGTSYDPMIAKLIAHGADARRGARPPRRRARRDGGRRRDDEPPVPALARRAPARARGPRDDGVPDRAPAALERRRRARRAGLGAAPWRLNLAAAAARPRCPTLDARRATHGRAAEQSAVTAPMPAP